MNKEVDMDKCLALAHKIARKYLKFAPSSMDENDLIQEGILGLLEKIDTFDPNECAFSTFAYNRICWRIIKYLRESGFIRLSDFSVKQKRKNGQDEIQIPVLSFSVLPPGEDDGWKEDKNWRQSFTEAESRLDVNKILNLLSKEERELIEIYYGLNGKAQMGMHKIAALKRRSSDTIYKRLNKISKKIKSLVR